MIIDISLKTEPSPKYVKINTSNEEIMYKFKHEIKLRDNIQRNLTDKR